MVLLVWDRRSIFYITINSDDVYQKLMETIHTYHHPKYGHSHVQITNNEHERMFLQLMSNNEFGHAIQKLFLTEEDLHEIKKAIEKYLS